MKDPTTGGWCVNDTYGLHDVHGEAICLVTQHLQVTREAGAHWGWNKTMLREKLQLGYSLEWMHTPWQSALCLTAIQRWGGAQYGVDIELSEQDAGSPHTLVFSDDLQIADLLAITDFPWTEGPSSRIRINGVADWEHYDLLSVLVHEVGHGIGLIHSNKADAIMRPLYTGQRRPGWSDFHQAEELYLLHPVPRGISGIFLGEK